MWIKIVSTTLNTAEKNSSYITFWFATTWTRRRKKLHRKYIVNVSHLIFLLSLSRPNSDLNWHEYQTCLAFLSSLFSQSEVFRFIFLKRDIRKRKKKAHGSLTLKFVLHLMVFCVSAYNTYKQTKLLWVCFVNISLSRLLAL
jgi:hypothetical protein